MKAICSLSGGMDSATAMVAGLFSYSKIYAVGFSYGAKHNSYENEMARRFCSHYKILFQLIDLSQVMKSFSSNLLKSGGEIPEGHYQEENMSLTVVPGRNLIFASILAGLAESLGAQAIIMGVHQGDHNIYPDCRPEFVRSLSETIALSSDKKVKIWTPFANQSKGDILKFGLQHEVPYHLTRTCYKDQEISCGRCGSCVERLLAFDELKATDPIDYEDREFYKKTGE